MRKLRRKDREIKVAEAEALLLNGEYGVLSTVGKDGQPYGVPLCYTYDNNCIYFHCAISGHKIENFEYNPRVSFCVVGKTQIVPSEHTIKYESVVVFGIISKVLDSEKFSSILSLLDKYSSNYIEEGKEVITKMDKVTKVYKIEIDHICGKAHR